MGSHMCWSGGLMTSMCDSGLCMCKWNHHPVAVGGGRYECREGMSNLAAAMANNATQEEIQDLLDNQQHADRMAAYNVLTGAAWVVASQFALAGRPLRSMVTRTSWVEITARREQLASLAHAALPLRLQCLSYQVGSPQEHRLPREKK